MPAEANFPSNPRVSVVMPTYDHAAFISRAIESLLAQTLTDWELLIIDDGSRDGTREVVGAYLDDARVRYHRRHSNAGIGTALNFGLERSRGEMVAYLPSDDVYYDDHLASLVDILLQRPEAVLAYSGVRHHYDRFSTGQIERYSLQLVQVVHRLTDERWVERVDLVTDDLDRMFWAKLRARGPFLGTGRVSCEWVDHPLQHHKFIREGAFAGVNPYRTRYGVEHPLRFVSSVANAFDEREHYRQFRERPNTPMAVDGLTILLVGELAHNPERVLALEERGHKLYGLWTPDPWGFNTVGPLPFGHVEDLPRRQWRDAVRELKPDLIYALLNWQAVPFAHDVLTENPGVPFVWHFKEGPFFCIQHGLWPKLVDLCVKSDGQIYSTPQMRDWLDLALPGEPRDRRSVVLDGDLPKREWFTFDRSPRLSEWDGEIHTVVVGRPVGFEPDTVGELARNGIHLHCYGAFQGSGQTWAKQAKQRAGRYLHLHPHVGSDGWVRELSQYDAGWLHLFKSDNRGDLRRARWEDLNYPARTATLAAAGLPSIQYDNSGSTVATQRLAEELDIGLVFRDIEHLGQQLRAEERMAELRENAWRQRVTFTFDHHADHLIAFFRDVIGGASATDRSRSSGRGCDVSTEVEDQQSPSELLQYLRGLYEEAVRGSGYDLRALIDEFPNVLRELERLEASTRTSSHVAMGRTSLWRERESTR